MSEAIIAAIMRGEDVRPAIWDRNATLADRIADRMEADQHDPKGCRVAHCVHGNPVLVRAQREHAATLRAERRTMGVAP